MTKAARQMSNRTLLNFIVVNQTPTSRTLFFCNFFLSFSTSITIELNPNHSKKFNAEVARNAEKGDLPSTRPPG